MRCLRRIWSNVRRLAAWAPVIWRDSDTDFVDLYDIIAFKLRRMARHQREHQLHEDWERQWVELVTAAWVASQVGRAEGDEDNEQLYIDRLCETLRRQSRGWWC